MENLLFKNKELLQKNLYEWVNDLKSRNENYGEVLAGIWNQYAEDRAFDSLELYDLNDKPSFLDFFFKTGFSEKSNKCNSLKANIANADWAMYNPDAEDGEKYSLYTDYGLTGLIATNIVEIAECMMVWPSLYPRDFYEAIMWDIIRETGFVISFGF